MNTQQTAVISLTDFGNGQIKANVQFSHPLPIDQSELNPVQRVALMMIETINNVGKIEFTEKGTEQ